MYIWLVDHWHTMWSAIINDVKRLITKTIHQHSGALERKWNRPDPFFQWARKMQSGDETTIPDPRVLLLCGATLQVITMRKLRHIQLE